MEAKVAEYCEVHLQRCNGTEYVGFCKDLYNFDNYKDYFETPMAFIAMFLGILVILISIYGRIEGSYRYCVINAAILHLLWPIFNKIAGDMIVRHIIIRYKNRNIHEYLWVNVIFGKFLI